MQHDEPAEGPEGLGDTGGEDVPPAEPGLLTSEVEVPAASPVPRELVSGDPSAFSSVLGARDLAGSGSAELAEPSFGLETESARGGDLHQLHPTAKTPPRTGDALLGLMIIVVAFGGSMLFSLWARDASIAPAAPPPGPPLVELEGFPDQIRPLRLLSQARQMSVRQHFQGFVAEGVRSDGTIDLTKKGNQLRFSFQDRKGRGPQPAREGGTLPARTYCGRQSVIVGKDGMTVKEDAPSIPCSRSEVRELPVPSSCRIEDVWTVAKAHQFRLGRPARLEYYRSKAGPAFRLVQKNRKQRTLSLVVSARDCRSVLTGKKQRGSVP